MPAIMTAKMAQKRHCLICGSLIFAGMYCSSCYAEMKRIRTSDDLSYDEWLAQTRKEQTSGKTKSEGAKDLYLFE